MPESVRNLIKTWSESGMRWPFVFDPVEGVPSVTLMFFYITFVSAVGIVLASSILMLLKGDNLTATMMPTMLLVLGFVFYRLRKLDNVKIDLDDKSIELTDDSDKGK